MQNAKCPSIYSNSEVIELFLCEARRQNRSIVSLCEDFESEALVQKEPIRTNLVAFCGLQILHRHISTLFTLEMFERIAAPKLVVVTAANNIQRLVNRIAH